MHQIMRPKKQPNPMPSWVWPQTCWLPLLCPSQTPGLFSNTHDGGDDVQRTHTEQQLLHTHTHTHTHMYLYTHTHTHTHTKRASERERAREHDQYTDKRRRYLDCSGIEPGSAQGVVSMLRELHL